jgi:hypothetical protein
MNPAAMIIAFALLSAAVVFTVVTSVVAAIGGWRRLAKAYPCQTQIVGTTWSWQSAELRYGAGYNGCLRMTANATGLRVETMFFLRISHPPLFFPWEETTLERTIRLFGIESVRFHFEREPDIPFTISRRLATKIQTAIGAAWPENTTKN